MAKKDKAIVSEIKNLTLNQALAIQLKLKHLKNEIAPKSPGRTRIVNQAKLKSTPEHKAIEDGTKGE